MAELVRRPELVEGGDNFARTAHPSRHPRARRGDLFQHRTATDPRDEHENDGGAVVHFCLTRSVQGPRMHGGWIYMMTNRPFGTLHIGVTNDIARRAWEHRQGTRGVFTSRYKLTRLVFVERHDDIVTAIQREKTMKQWRRRWKLNAIEAQNPLWEDLFDRLNM
jgi:putative endonuclease